MQIHFQDNFGAEIAIGSDLNSAALNAFFRFHLDGMLEGISEQWISGEAGENELRYFGLIQ